jgi:predicted TIM-barrel fold metal-dependent hydrolase
MLTRREVLAGAVLAGTAGLFRHDEVHAAAAQPHTKVSIVVPPGATDCAVHVFGDTTRHPYFEGRTYTPEPATVAELKQMMRALGVERVVVVQASTYGTDNSCVLDSIRELGRGARGVAVIDDKTTEASLDEMHRGGVRGIRLSLGNQGATNLAAAKQRVKAASDRLKNRKGWSVLISGTPETWDALRVELAGLALPIVIDHFGEPRVGEGVGQPGFAAVLSLVQSGKAYVKLSNAETLAARPDLSDVTPYAKALIAANPQRVVWGTAWPHPSAGAVPGRKPTDLAVHRQTDDGRMMNMLAVWAPDAAMRKTILVDNAARLYGFEGP